MKAHGEEDIWEQWVRYLNGACSEEEVRALAASVEEDAANAEPLAEILTQSAAVREICQASPQPYREASTGPGVWREWAAPLTAAAAVIVAGWVWVNQEPSWVMRATHVSGSVRWMGKGGSIVESLKANTRLPGGTVETISDDAVVVLEFRDGSTVTLLTHSSATLSDQGQKRVHLKGGNLSADVRPQPKGRPMLIQTAAAELEVVGTRFDLESGAVAMRLNVEEGTVRVTRRWDGSVVEVSSQHEVVASLDRKKNLAAVGRRPPSLEWASNLRLGAKGTTGEWLPPDDGLPARLRTMPQLLTHRNGEDVTIYSVGLTIPWEGLQTLQLRPTSHLRVRGRMNQRAPVVIMLNTKRLGGGFAGNHFKRVTPESLTWQMDLQVQDFFQRPSDPNATFPEGLQLRRVAIYTPGIDAGLEIEQVEVLHSDEP